MSSVKEQTIKSIKWSFFEKLGGQGVQFILGLIMARLLLPEDFGVIGIVTVFFALSTTFVDSGFGNALIRKIGVTEDDYCTVFYFNIIISIIIYLLLYFSAPFISDFFNLPILIPIIRVQSISIIINSFIIVQVAKLTSALDFKSLAKRNVFATIMSGLIGICLAYIGYGIWALIYQGIIQSVINLISVNYYCKWFPKKGFSIVSFKELGSFGSKLLASSLLHTIYGNLSSFIIGKFYSPKELGYFTRGAQIAMFPTDAFDGVVGKVTFPILSKLQNEDERLAVVYRKYIRISSLFVFLGCGLMAALAEPIVNILLTEKWSQSIVFLQIYSFTAMFNHINSINLNLLKVKGRSDLYLRLEIIKKAISILILFISIPFGVIAICFSRVVYNQIAIVLNTYYSGKLINVGYWIQVKDFLIFLIFSLISILPAFFISYLDIPDIAKILFSIPISLFIYYCLLRSNDDMKEVIDIAKTYMLKLSHKNNI